MRRNSNYGLPKFGKVRIIAVLVILCMFLCTSGCSAERPAVSANNVTAALTSSDTAVQTTTTTTAAATTSVKTTAPTTVPTTMMTFAPTTEKTTGATAKPTAITAAQTTVYKAAEAQQITAIVNISTKKYHLRSNCYTIKNMLEKNKMIMEVQSVDELKSRGYVPCKVCAY